MLYIASCFAVSNVLRKKSFVIFASYHANWCSCLSRISIFEHFLFYYFNNILLLVISSAIDYLCLFLRKRCFVKFENKSLFDCKLTRHHQRIKCTEEINDCHKKEDFAKSLKYVYRGSIYKFSFLEFLASHLVFTTVTWGISRKVKFVDEVGSTVFYKNIFDCHHFFFLCL